MENIVCLFSSAHGVYVPQAFVKGYMPEKWGIEESDVEILLAGPEHADYWDTWDTVLNRAQYTSDDGRKYHLHLDGDLFAIAYDALTDDEYREFFGEDRH